MDTQDWDWEYKIRFTSFINRAALLSKEPTKPIEYTERDSEGMKTRFFQT